MLLFSIKGNITDFWLNISSGVSVQFLVTISKENQNDLVTNHPSITLCWRTISLGVIAGDRGLSSLKVPQFAWSLIIVINHLIFLAATTQLYEWYFYLSVCLSVVCPSVCLSVCLSVTPFRLCSHHRIIMKFSGVITKDQGNVHAKGQGQRSKVKVTVVTTQLNRFRTVTPVWIHIWWWNDTYSLMLLRRGALLFFKVIRQI